MLILTIEVLGPSVCSVTSVVSNSLRPYGPRMIAKFFFFINVLIEI